MEINKNYDLKEIVYLCEYDNIIKTEVFKDVPGYEGLYQVSNLGRVKSYHRKNPKILVNKIDRKGYQFVCLCNNIQKDMRVGQLVAITFLDHKPDGTQKYVVDHKNRIRNDDRLVNLQVITQRQNVDKDTTNKNGYLGVNKGLRCKNYVAKIRINGIVTRIGSYKTAEEASEAYKNKVNELEK